MKEIVEEKLNWIIFQSDDPDTWPADDDRKNQLYLVRPGLTTDDVIVARYDRKTRKFRDGNMLFHGSLWPKWKSLDDLLPTRHKRN